MLYVLPYSSSHDMEMLTFNTEYKVVYEAGAIQIPIIIDLGEYVEVCDVSHYLTYGDFLADNEITKLPAFNTMPYENDYYMHKDNRPDGKRKRKPRFIIMATAALVIGGMSIWSLYTAHEAKDMVENNRHLLDASRTAIIDLEHDMNNRVLLIERNLNSAIARMDDAICNLSASLMHHMAVQHLNQKFDRLMDTLYDGRLNTAILPLSSLKNFISQYAELRDGLYHVHPQLLYELASVEVISEDLQTTSVMRGAIRVPHLSHAYENLTMKFIISSRSILGPIMMGSLTNRSTINCDKMGNSMELLVCPTFIINNHTIPIVSDPVSMHHGVIVVNHGITVMVDPGKYINPKTPFRKTGPFILDRSQAVAVSYNDQKWFLEPSAFKVQHDSVIVTDNHISIPVFGDNNDGADAIIYKLNAAFNEHPIDPLTSISADAGSVWDSISSFITTLWQLIKHWQVCVLIILIVIIIIILNCMGIRPASLLIAMWSLLSSLFKLLFNMKCIANKTTKNVDVERSIDDVESSMMLSQTPNILNDSGNVSEVSSPGKRDILTAREIMKFSKSQRRDSGLLSHWQGTPNAPSSHK